MNAPSYNDSLEDNIQNVGFFKLQDADYFINLCFTTFFLTAYAL